MQAQLLKYTDKCFHSLGINLVLALSDSTIESIHSLRLNIKKIRTLLKIIDYKQSIRTEDKTVKALNNIFTYSGLLRDIHIEIQLLITFREQAENEYKSLIRILKNEQKKCEKLLKSSIVKLNPFDIVLLSKRIEQSFEMQSGESLVVILQKKAEYSKREFFQLIKGGLGENSLHRIRIVIKEYINILNLLRKGTGSSQINTSFIEELDNLQRRIGEWHDLKLLHEYVFNQGFNVPLLIGIIKNEKDKLQIEIKKNLLKIEI